MKWAQEYNKPVLNILCELICDIITCSVWRCDMVENQKKKRENMETKEIFT